MAFTDKDLAHFKDDIHCDECDTPNKIRFAKLIARLEASEVCAENYAKRCPTDPDTLAWRKAAGK